MYKLFRTKQFIKDYSRIKLSDKQYEKYITFISLLLDNKKLPSQAKDHELIGDHKGFKELHISGDILLIYIIEDEYLKLVRIGTHSQLFK